MGRDKNCLTEICETIEDSADVANVVILAREFAADLGFSQTDQHLVATAVSELTTNIVHYAGRGKLTIQEISSPKNVGLQIICEDRGPGIADIEMALTDEYSTGESLGMGLPSVKRLMDYFEIETEPQAGTRVMIRKWRDSN